MEDCKTCDPCDAMGQYLCDELSESDSPVRIVAENAASCPMAYDKPEQVSVLQYRNSSFTWRDGSEQNNVTIPEVQSNPISTAPKLIVIDGNKEVKSWQPSNTGDNFFAYWDGSDFTLGTLLSFLPSGDGVLVKNGNTLSFQNGSNSDYLQIISGIPQFAPFTVEPPAGTMFCYPAAVAPTGWLICDGSAVSRITYLDLFAVIGTIYGSGNGSTTFNLPDLRGIFLRGVDFGKNIDPARVYGSLQNHGFENHSHGGITSQESSHTHSLSATSSIESQNHIHFISNADAITNTDPFTLPEQLLATNHLIQKHEFFPYPSYRLLGSATEATVGLTDNDSTDHIHGFNTTTSSPTPHNHTINSHGTTDTRPVNIALNWIIKT